MIGTILWLKGKRGDIFGTGAIHGWVARTGSSPEINYRRSTI
jgi:hypothetical protein